MSFHKGNITSTRNWSEHVKQTGKYATRFSQPFLREQNDETVPVWKTPYRNPRRSRNSTTRGNFVMREDPDRASFIRRPPCSALRGTLVYNEEAYRHSQQELIQTFITRPLQTPAINLTPDECRCPFFVPNSTKLQRGGGGGRIPVLY